MKTLPKNLVWNGKELKTKNNEELNTYINRKLGDEKMDVVILKRSDAMMLLQFYNTRYER